ncbi:MAG: exodeoxyribonuclease VII large subunit [Calditrichaceae bacterium]
MPTTSIHSVSDITRLIKTLIEENIPAVWVEGEISNYKPHYSGHVYFTLKDANAQISAVMWKSRKYNLTFEPEDGMLIQALGTIRLYEKSGRYQLDIIRMQPSGIGKLQLAFEQLKQKLDAEGLFDPEHKKAIPAFPEKIGVVTSETGAAIKDIINVIERRAPHVQLIIKNAKVQGVGAASDIVKAIEGFNKKIDVDLLIVGRGGGSYEDLWAFNEEIVARAIYNSKIPVISAVGHEIDFTISDFVADLRAPTPSAAAEIAVPDADELKDNIRYIQKRMHDICNLKIEIMRDRINYFKNSYGFKKPLDIIKQYALQVDDLSNKLQKSISSLLGQRREYCNQFKIRLENLDPKKVLERGYSISYIDDKLIKNVNMVDINSNMHTEFASGTVWSKINRIEGTNDAKTK